MKQAMEKLTYGITFYAPTGLALPIPFGPLKGSLWIARSGAATNALGVYELDKANFVSKKVRKNAVFFDIGASAGYYTILASHAVGAGGRVVSFEPNPLNLACLRRHIQLNRLRNVDVIEAAISNFEGMLSFDPIDSTVGRLTGRLARSGGLLVRSVRLDTMMESGFPVPHYIKMNIEGGEFEALLGARRLLSECPVEIFLATHGEEIRLRCLDLLDRLGYTATPIAGREMDLYCKK